MLISYYLMTNLLVGKLERRVASKDFFDFDNTCMARISNNYIKNWVSRNGSVFGNHVCPLFW